MKKRLSLTAPSTAEKLLRLGLAVLVISSPLLTAWILTALEGFDLFRALPLWNDEIWWHLQYGAMSEYGRPLGYFGFIGTHAPAGTFACWGMYAMLPVGLLARLFGWGLHTFVYCNFFYLALANLVFILLARPSKRGLVLLAITNMMQYVTVCYSVTSMSEAIRCAMAIMLAGVMYRILTVPEPTRRQFILRVTTVPLFLIFATCFDLVLGLYIPVYLFLMLRKQPLRRQLPVTAVGSAGALLLLKLARDLTCAPYLPDQGAGFVPTDLRMKITLGFFSFMDRLKDVDLLTLLSEMGGDQSTTFKFWFCLLIYAAMIVLCWRVTAAARARRWDGTRSLDLLCLYILASCWGGLLLLYDTSTWTFMRHYSVAICSAMLLAAMAPRGQDLPWQVMAATCLAGAVLFLTVFTTSFATAGRFSSDWQEADWAAERDVLAEVIALDEDAADPWANTVVPYGFTTEQYYCLPYGVGINTAMSDPADQQARYAILGSDYSDASAREGVTQGLTAAGYKVIYEDESFVVMEKQDRAYD